MLFSTQFFLLGFLPPVLLLFHLVSYDRRLRWFVLVSTSLRPFCTDPLAGALLM